MIFVPETDVLASHQYFAHFGRSGLEPEKRLMLAILQDAVECFQNYAGARDGTRERHFREAKDWILASDSEWPFSFENICAALDLQPSYLRNGLLKKLQVLRGTSAEQTRLNLRSRVNPVGIITSMRAARMRLRKGVAVSTRELGAEANARSQRPHTSRLWLRNTERS